MFRSFLRALLNRNDSFFMNPNRFDGNVRIYVLSGNPVLRIVNVFSRSELRIIRPRSVDESDDVHACVRFAASLCFVFAVQARKLSLSASLGWAEEAQKRHAWNIDGDTAIVEVLSYPLCFRLLRLVVVALGRSSWWQNWACDRHDFF